MWEFLAAVLSAIVALITFFLGWRKARENALRKEEVLAWSNSVIRSLQSLVLVCQGRNGSLTPDAERQRLLDIYFETSVLAEQGRLLFRNEAQGDYGKEKPEAYRGRRPEILDQVIVAHQIAGAFAGADAPSRARMCCVADDVARRFVSLAQKEVGRSRTASAETRKGGTGVGLPALMQAVPAERLAG